MPGTSALVSQDGSKKSRKRTNIGVFILPLIWQHVSRLAM